MSKAMKVHKRTGGCPFCGGSGACYGQCPERFKAMVVSMVAPLRKLQRDIETILAKRKRGAKR